MAHAILSPSAASRWMACTPSARLEQQVPNRSSSYAEEGTLAHAIAELILRDPEDFSSQLEILKKSEYYSEEMLEHSQAFADLVNSYYTTDSHLFIEQKLDMTNYIQEGFGTSDATLLRDGTMRIFDLKYGKGVPVYADHNKQMMIYALGALNTLGVLYDVKDVEMHIYQPRLDNHSAWHITREELEHWAETELREKAALAYKGEGRFQPGPHCGFCRVKATCRALHDHNMELAKLEFAEPELLTGEEIAKVLDRRKQFIDWINAVADYALDSALSGEEVPGYKVVEGRSVRVYADPDTVAEKLKKNGFTDIYKPQTLLGITELTKRIKKKAFTEIVEPELVKPKGKPALVPQNDPRKPFTASAEEVFSQPVE